MIGTLLGGGKLGGNLPRNAAMDRRQVLRKDVAKREHRTVRRMCCTRFALPPKTRILRSAALCSGPDRLKELSGDFNRQQWRPAIQHIPPTSQKFSRANGPALLRHGTHNSCLSVFWRA